VSAQIEPRTQRQGIPCTYEMIRKKCLYGDLQCSWSTRTRPEIIS